MKNSFSLPGLVLMMVVLLGCSPSESMDADQPLSQDPPTLLLNITSSGEDDPHSVTMALQLARHALDAGRTTVLFFNVRGVTTPTTGFPPELAFNDQPIRELLESLMEAGAEVHVCPHCMEAMGLQETDLIPGARVTTQALLFGHLGGNTVVFTY